MHRYIDIDNRYDLTFLRSIHIDMYVKKYSRKLLQYFTCKPDPGKKEKEL